MLAFICLAWIGGDSGCGSSNAPDSSDTGDTDNPSTETTKFDLFESDDVTGISGYSTFNEQTTDISFKVPANWEQKDQFSLNGIDYTGGSAVVWRGPRNSVTGAGYTALILFIVPVTAGGTATSTLENYADVLKENRILGEGEATDDIDTELGGEAAIETSIVYINPAELEYLGTSATNRQESWIVIQKGDYYIDIRYSAVDADYDTYLEAYTKAKETFQ